MSKTKFWLVPLACLLAGLASCDDDDTTNNGDGGGGTEAGTTEDGGGTTDVAMQVDTGTASDARDAGAGSDARDAGMTADTGMAGDGGAGDGTAAAVKFSTVYTMVIAKRCTPCHTTPTGIGITSGHLDMSTAALAFQNLVNVPAAGTACSGMGTRVIPGMPATSLLYRKVDPDQAAPCGSKMPLNGPALPAPEEEMIEDWIAAGAPNN